MPEAPEVQTIVSDLNRKIIGRKIVDVWTDWPKMIKTGAKVFEKGIKGAKIQKVRRRGKNILIYLTKKPRTKNQKLITNDYLLLIHQKMTGHLLVGKWEVKKVSSMKYQVLSMVKGPLQERVNDFIRLIFYLDNGQMLALSDMRRFAKVLFGPAEEIEKIKELKELGPDPLNPKTTFADFKLAIVKRRGPIKQVLMDQTAVSGIGNIYASDILWLARIHPMRPADKLKESELKVLWSASKKVLKQALKLRGTSTADFRDTSGRKGRYGEVRLAYQRTGEPCRRCKTLIKRLKQGGRSAFYCPKCQRL
ncbi:MAG: bifunctional DNA-formamidopyrimidine glycosylase/DNA-(apurinic or apyrimidinic site) lyase [Candidatus Colwellbacteria bacterium]|nr:bifunctional DNA-formamidopyrimidine glycosylase/DNA-(apurinic or apyrimidinic site) lyase [Candidatus Colwellbacteria bacterium]